MTEPTEEVRLNVDPQVWAHKVALRQGIDRYNDKAGDYLRLSEHVQSRLEGYTPTHRDAALLHLAMERHSALIAWQALDLIRHDLECVEHRVWAESLTSATRRLDSPTTYTLGGKGLDYIDPADVFGEQVAALTNDLEAE